MDPGIGMHDTIARMRQTIATLSRFYAQRHEQVVIKSQELGRDFDPELADLDDITLDQPYYEYARELSKGVEPVLAQLGVTLDPVPPGVPAKAVDETLMGGARLLKWNVSVNDAKTGEYLGRFEWALYHRHDRFAVPGPAQITYLQARPGKTIMVG